MFVGTANLLRVDYNSMEGDGSRHINMIARQALEPKPLFPPSHKAFPDEV
jgi:hypothetical protein